MNALPGEQVKRNRQIAQTCKQHRQIYARNDKRPRLRPTTPVGMMDADGVWEWSRFGHYGLCCGLRFGLFGIPALKRQHHERGVGRITG